MIQYNLLHKEEQLLAHHSTSTCICDEPRVSGSYHYLHKYWSLQLVQLSGRTVKPEGFIFAERDRRSKSVEKYLRQILEREVGWKEAGCMSGSLEAEEAFKDSLLRVPERSMFLIHPMTERLYRVEESWRKDKDKKAIGEWYWSMRAYLSKLHFLLAFSSAVGICVYNPSPVAVAQQADRTAWRSELNQSYRSASPFVGFMTNGGQQIDPIKLQWRC